MTATRVSRSALRPRRQPGYLPHLAVSPNPQYLTHGSSLLPWWFGFYPLFHSPPAPLLAGFFNWLWDTLQWASEKPRAAPDTPPSAWGPRSAQKPLELTDAVPSELRVRVTTSVPLRGPTRLAFAVMVICVSLPVP